MKVFVLIAAMFTSLAFADSYTYQVYYDQEKTEALDIRIEITMNGPFKSKGTITNIKIWGRKSTLLFNFTKKDLEANWLANNTVEITSKETVKPLVKEEYTPIHSDTGIIPGEEFDIFLTINQDGTLRSDEEGFYLANQTAQEMGLSGFLNRE